MSPTSKKSFDCLAFKWKVQAEIYQEIKDQSPEEQIEYFRHHAKSGLFAELVRNLQQDTPSRKA